VSRRLRRSIASSLCALGLLAAGCGESNTHGAAEVREALASHGIGDIEAMSTEAPPEARSKVSAAQLRIDVLLSYYASRLAGLAEHKTARVNLVGDAVSIIVATDPTDAAWIERSFRYYHFPENVRQHVRRIDNLVVLEGGPRVDAALADLR